MEHNGGDSVTVNSFEIYHVHSSFQFTYLSTLNAAVVSLMNFSNDAFRFLYVLFQEIIDFLFYIDSYLMDT